MDCTDSLTCEHRVVEVDDDGCVWCMQCSALLPKDGSDVEEV